VTQKNAAYLNFDEVVKSEKMIMPVIPAKSLCRKNIYYCHFESPLKRGEKSFIQENQLRKIPHIRSE